MIRPLIHSVTLFAFLFLVGCQIPVEAPIESISRVDEYFWKPSSDTLRYDVYLEGSLGMPVRHSVWVDHYNDGYIAHDLANDQMGIIISRSNPGQVVLTEIHASSLFPLPQGAYISNGEEPKEIKFFLPVDALYFGANNAVVFSNQVSYTNTSKDWQSKAWQSSSLFVSGRITAIASSPGGVLYAGNNVGTVFKSSDAGNTWNTIRSSNSGDGETVGIVVVDTNVFVAVYNSGVYVSRAGLAFEQLGPTAVPPNVTGMALVYNSSQYNDNEVIVSTEDSGIWYGTLNGSGWRTRGATGIRPGDKLLGLYGYNKEPKYVVTSRDGLFFTSLDTGRTWVANELTPWAQGEEITCVARTGDERIFFGTSHGKIFQALINGGGVSQIGQIDTAVNAITFSNQQLIVASAKGLSEVVSSVSNRDHLGPYEIREDTVEAEFVLLQSNSVELQVEDSWMAGYLYFPQVPGQNKNVPLTARVMERLDTLQALGESFTDVIAVRYAYEAYPGQPLSGMGVPYWMIYYGRGIGPVMIDEVVPSNDNNTRVNNSRTILRRQY